MAMACQPNPAMPPLSPTPWLALGCPADCRGYELAVNLNFDTNDNGRADARDAYWNAGAGWEPLGNPSEAFSGIFDGGGHHIKNLHINNSGQNYVGLFGITASGSVVKRIGLVNAYVHSGRGIASVGALAGQNGGDISNSYAEGRKVSGGGNTGGLVGMNYNGKIIASYATVSTVRGRTYASHAGGLVGSTIHGKIAASFATGKARGMLVGGLVGLNIHGTITTSYATGNVYSDIAAQFKGGLVGQNGGKVTKSYAIGTGCITGKNVSGGTVTRSYWNSDVSSSCRSSFGKGKTLSELQAPTGYTGIYAGWNVDLDNDGRRDDPWDFGSSSQYPILKYGNISIAAQTTDPGAERPTPP